MINDKEQEIEKLTDEQEKELALSKYINPLTDFGFKYLFGAKESMIDFLNSVLNIKGGIVSVTYDNTERIPHSEDERKAYFDLHCVTGTGEHVIIEMQNHSQKFFRDRTLYYAAFEIEKQSQKGGDWSFELYPVISLNILNFIMTDDNLTESKPKQRKLAKSKGKYVSYIQLIDKDTKEVFSEKLAFVFLELPPFNKSENELQTGMDKWMFVLKNLVLLNDLPDALRNDVFERVFLMAEIAALSPEKRKEYYKSLKSYRDMNNIVGQKEQKIVELTKKNAELTKENAAYKREIAELRRHIGSNSGQINHY